MTINLRDHLKAAKLPERTVGVCLRGDLTGALVLAEAALEAASGQRQDQRMTGVSAEQAAVNEARAAVEAAALPFRLRGLSRPGWTALVNEHPPREGNADDRLMGFNTESFPVALVRACLVDPDVTDDADWDALDEAMTFAQYDELVTTAMEVSRRKVDVPFSSGGSVKTANSAPKSSRPAA